MIQMLELRLKIIISDYIAHTPWQNVKFVIYFSHLTFLFMQLSAYTANEQYVIFITTYNNQNSYGLLSAQGARVAQ
jgi:hypothetical protein